MENKTICLTQNAFLLGGPQTDLVTRILKESLSMEHKCFYLVSFLKQCNEISTALIPVLQMLLDSKLPVDEGISNFTYPDV